MTGDDMTDLALATRAGLPDALRVLLARYPRPDWPAHPQFDGLTRFWLERHLSLRRLHGLLAAETEALLDRATDPREAAGRLAGLGNRFLGDLTGHHQVEDHHYFPLLRAQDARLEAGFDLLDADHDAIHDGVRTLAERANATLQGLAATPADLAPQAALHADLDRFGRLLERHLTDEEDLIVPVILAHRIG